MTGDSVEMTVVKEAQKPRAASPVGHRPHQNRSSLGIETDWMGERQVLFNERGGEGERGKYVGTCEDLAINGHFQEEEMDIVIFFHIWNCFRSLLNTLETAITNKAVWSRNATYPTSQMSPGQWTRLRSTELVCKICNRYLVQPHNKDCSLANLWSALLTTAKWKRTFSTKTHK